LEKDIEKYEGVYSKGWDTLRKERINRMKQIGLIDKEWLLSEPPKDIPSWTDVENKDWEIRRMKTYAAQIDAMDQGIGQIIDYLDQNNLLDNTIILFLSDNGGCAETFNQETEWVRKYGPKTTLTGKEVIYGNESSAMAGTPDTYMSYGEGWANLSNTPFKYYKHYGYEGGVATPFIVHWPSGLSRKNEFVNEVASILDVMPTVLEATNTPYPVVYNGHSIKPLEGESLLSVFAGKQLERKNWFMEHEGNRAIRNGKWKLVSARNKEWELYNMEKDRTETKNLRNKYPQTAKELETLWDSWAQRVGVYPNK
jgi:arylsulfatase